MIVQVTEQFNKDISKLRDKKLILSVKKNLQKIESVNNLSEISQIKKLEGNGSYFRLRIRDYRMGIFVEGKVLYIVRFLHRKEIYKYFP